MLGGGYYLVDQRFQTRDGDLDGIRVPWWLIVDTGRGKETNRCHPCGFGQALDDCPSTASTVTNHLRGVINPVLELRGDGGISPPLHIVVPGTIIALLVSSPPLKKGRGIEKISFFNAYPPSTFFIIRALGKPCTGTHVPVKPCTYTTIKTIDTYQNCLVSIVFIVVFMLLGIPSAILSQNSLF